MGRLRIALGSSAMQIVGALLLAAVQLHAQGVEISGERGPKFLLAPSDPNGETTLIDVRRTAVLRRPVTLDFDNVTIKSALATLTEQSGIDLVYSDDVLPSDARVTLHAQGIAVAAALTQILLDAQVDVIFLRNGTATLRKQGAPFQSSTVRTTGTITGVVRDSVTGVPLPNVSLHVESSRQRTVSDATGSYTISGVPEGAQRVTARRIGYAQQTLDVRVADGLVRLDFGLVPAPTQLGEVVTTAIGPQRRIEVGNVIAHLNVDSIVRTAPVTSLTDIISARVPGVQVQEAGGLAGSGAVVRVRGQSSLVLQGDPIVIIDGVRANNSAGSTYSPALGVAVASPSRLNDLDFNQIETIDILKGPAASTEYGTDAANGVIVITTKQGSGGRPQWIASGEQDRSKIPVKFPEYYYGWGHTTDGDNTPVQCPLTSLFGAPASTTGTCVTDSVTHFNPLNRPAYSVFGTGTRGKYSLSLSGGTEALRYFMAGGLSNEIGILQLPDVFRSQAQAIGFPASARKPSREDQRSFRVNTAIRLGPSADVTVSAAYLSTSQQAPNDLMLMAAPGQGISLPDSAHNYGYPYLFYAPLTTFGASQTQDTQRLTGGLTANWHPLAWLGVHATAGVDHGSQQVEGLFLPQSLAVGGASSGGLISEENGGTDIYSADARVSARASLTPAMVATTSFGIQLADTRSKSVLASANGFSAENLTLNGAVNPAVVQLADRQSTLGGYGEEQLNFGDRLFLTGALRFDAGSGFGRDYNVAVYPKASVSWLALSHRLANVRLRGATGQSGVQPPNGGPLQLYSRTVQWLNGGPVSVIQIIAPGNSRLGPERSVEYEGGVDIGLGQGRVNLELTGYSKTTQNALFNQTLGWDLNALTYETNIGKVRNSGVEGSLIATLMRARNMTWDVSLNASVNRNQLVHLAPGIPPATDFQFRQSPGYPLYGNWGVQEHYSDSNHNGIIEPNEITLADSASYMGSSVPTRQASLATHASVMDGALTVGVLLDYRGGYRVLNSVPVGAARNGTLREQNDPKAPLWLQARAAASLLPNAFSEGYPSGYFEDGTFLRFRELSLTYTVPPRWGRAIGAQRTSLTVAVRNLALWTRYTGPDPEVTSAGGGSVPLAQFNSNTIVVDNNRRGDQGAVPLLRYLVLRLNVGF